MELNDTVEMMLSDDYKERFRAEYWQLSIRYRKLREMLRLRDAGKLNFEPTCNRRIFNLQLRAMEDYLAILESRAQIEGIGL